MSLYSLSQFQNLVREGEWDYLNTSRPEQTKDKLGWGDAQVATMLCGLTNEDFQKTVADCKVHHLPGRELIDADQYEIHWDDGADVRRPRPGAGTISLSLKIAIAADENGNFAGLVTLHTSGS